MSVPRIEALQASLPFMSWYATSRHPGRQGADGVVDLLFGNPHDMPIPGYVDALQRHLQPEDPSWFAYMFNHPPATATAAAGLARHTGMPWRAEDVAMTNGGWGAIAVAIRAVTEPGDEVIYYDPPWFFYDLLIRGAEAVPVSLRLEPPRFSPDPDQLARAITPRTRAVLINTPHNPTGRVLEASELDGIATVLREASERYGRPIYLLSDEAYREIVLDGRRAASPAEHYANTLVLYSYGKQLLAPGQRIGYLAISPEASDPEPLREAIQVTQFVNSFAFPNALLQRALPDIADLCIDLGAIQRRRDRIVPALEEMGYEPTNPEGTFYVLARSPIPDEVAFVAQLAEADVFVLPGSTIAMPGWFRISLTASDAMVDASIAQFEAARDAAVRVTA
jgi:aspartate aminotransferase